MPWSKVSTEKAPIVVVIAILIIIISLISILKSGSQQSAKVFDDRFVEFGRIAAEKTGGYLGQGARVVLLIHDKKTVEDTFVQHDKVFEMALKESGIHIVASETLQGDTQERGVPMVAENRMTVDDYIRIGEANPDVAAIVSLVGAPMADLAILNSIPESVPPIIIPRFFDPMFRPTALLRQGVIEMAIFTRQDAPDDPDIEFANLYEEFDAIYQVYTADNMDELLY